MIEFNCIKHGRAFETMGIWTVRCPDCGASYNMWRRAVGEYGQHLKTCEKRRDRMHEAYFATGCRGCPANCYERDQNDREKPTMG